MNTILSNAFLLLIPIFVWNALFWSKLPPEFEEKRFDTGVPKIMLILEHLFRLIIFAFPLLLHIDYSFWYLNPGFYIFTIGTVLYLFSWILLIKWPNSPWSKSSPGFSAPAYTTIFWLTGIAFFADRLYIEVPYSIWYYLAPSIVFAILHSIHALIALDRSRKL